MKLPDVVTLSSAAPSGFQPESAVLVRRERMHKKQYTEARISLRFFSFHGNGQIKEPTANPRTKIIDF